MVLWIPYEVDFTKPARFWLRAARQSGHHPTIRKDLSDEQVTPQDSSEPA